MPHIEQPACFCAAYGEVHERGQGLCEATAESRFCTSCGWPCEPALSNCGEGLYEYWGYQAVDAVPCIISTCCEAPVTWDSQGRKPYSPLDFERDHPYDPEG